MAHQKKLTITIQCDSISTAGRLLDHNVTNDTSSQECRESELETIFKALHAPALGTFGWTHQSSNTITCTYPNPTEIVRRDFSRVKKALHHPKGVKKVGKHGIEVVFFEREEYNARGHPSKHCTYANVKPIVKAEPLDAPPIPPAAPSSAVSLAPIGMSRRVATCPPGSSTWHAGQHVPAHAARPAAQRPNPSPFSPAMMGLSTCTALPGTQLFASPSQPNSFFAPMFGSTPSTTGVPSTPPPSRHPHQYRPYPPPRVTYTLSTTEGPDPSAASFPLTPVSPRYGPVQPIIIAASPRFEPCSPPYRPTSPGLRYDTPPLSCAGGRQVVPPTDYAQGESSSPSPSPSYSEAIDLEPWRLAYDHNGAISGEYESSCPSAVPGLERQEQQQQSFEEESEGRGGQPYGYYYHPDVEVLKDAEPIRPRWPSSFGKGARMCRRSGASHRSQPQESSEVMGLGLDLGPLVQSSSSELPGGVGERSMQYVKCVSARSAVPVPGPSSVAPASAPAAVPASLLWPSSVPLSIPSLSAASSSFNYPFAPPSFSYSSSGVPSQAATAARPHRDSGPCRFGSSVTLLSPLHLGGGCPPGEAPQAVFQVDLDSVSPIDPFLPPSHAPPLSGLEDVDIDSGLFLPPGLELGAEKVYRGYGYGYGAVGVDESSPSSLPTPDFIPPGLELGLQREYGIVPGMDMLKEGPVHPHVPVLTIKRPRLEDLVVAGRDTRKAKRTGGRVGGKPYDQTSARRRRRSASLEESGDDSDTSSSSTSTTISGSSSSASSSSASSLSSSSSTRTHGSRRSSHQYGSAVITDAELLKRLRKAESSIDSLEDVKKSVWGGVRPRDTGDRDQLERDVRKMGKRLDKLQQEYRLMLNLL